MRARQLPRLGWVSHYQRRNEVLGAFDPAEDTIPEEFLLMTIKSVLLSSAFFLMSAPAFAQTNPMPNAPTTPPARAGGFERLDANNDGAITRDEVRTARTAAFTRLDVNRDTFLDRVEMMAGRPMVERRGDGQSMGRPEGKGRAGEMLTRADTNNDGNVTRAEFDAALAAAQNQRAAKARERGQELFARLDTNRDGMITRVEADAARSAMQERRPDNARGQRSGMTNPDTNNDGKITLVEWLARPDPMFDRGDANNDGRLTREEAAAAVRAGRGDGKGRPSRPW
jgi:Ca2+-binding EF-hand superfamily protein